MSPDEKTEEVPRPSWQVNLDKLDELGASVAENGRRTEALLRLSGALYDLEGKGWMLYDWTGYEPDSGDGRCLAINKTLAELVGTTQEEWEDKRLGDWLEAFLHPDDLGKTESLITDTIYEGGVTTSFENRYRTADGGYVRIRWTAINEVRGAGVGVAELLGPA